MNHPIPPPKVPTAELFEEILRDISADQERRRALRADDFLQKARHNLSEAVAAWQQSPCSLQKAHQKILLAAGFSLAALLEIGGRNLPSPISLRALRTRLAETPPIHVLVNTEAWPAQAATASQVEMMVAEATSLLQSAETARKRVPGT